MKDLKIKIIEVKNIKTTDGKQFTAYKALTKDGKKIDCKFRADVKLLPKEACTIIVDDEQCNVSTNRQYPVLWVQEVKEIIPTEKKTNSGQFFD